MSDRARKQRVPRRVAHISGYTSERDFAELIGVALRTLRKWRQQGKGPPYVKIGKQVCYRDVSRDAWLKSCEIQPIRELTAA